MSTQTQSPIGTAVYRDRTYAILWAGETKFGSKLKLAFESDPDKTFWIPRESASRVELDQATTERERRNDTRSAANKTSLGAGEESREVRDSEPEPQTDPCYCASCGQQIPSEVPF